MDKMSEQEAREIFEKLVPEPGMRKQCLTLMADAIVHAHTLGPAFWEVTLAPVHISLNVGRIYFMRLQRREVRLVLDRKAMSDEEAARVEEASLEDSFRFAVVKDYVHAIIPLEHLASILPILQRVLQPSLAMCAKTVTRITPWHRAHSPGVLAYLRHVLVRQLPDPDYSAALVPEAGGALSNTGAVLSDDRLLAAWEQAFPKSEWEDWQAGYQELLERVRAMSDAELSKVESQRLLWSAKALTPVGPGENVKVEGAWTDPEIVQALLELRKREWPIEPVERAQAIQEVFDHLLELVHGRHSTARPIAKLHRLFGVLLPGEMHCVLQWRANQHVVELLLPPSLRGSMVASHVLARARLRELFGPEADLEEHVRRSVFCWHLHERYDELTGEAPPLQVEAPTPEKEQSRPLALWPFHKQMRGANYLNNAVELFREFLRVAVEGATRDEIVDRVLQEDPWRTFSRTSVAYMLMDLNRLGFLEQRGNGLLFPNKAGEELLEDEQADILVERLLERVFGSAHILRLLDRGKEGMTGQELTIQLQQLYPQWTSAVMPSRMRTWCATLGLIEKSDNGRWRLTGPGRGWTTRLPEELPHQAGPIGTGTIEDDEADVSEGEVSTSTGSSPAVEMRPFPSLEAILQRFREDPEVAGFVFDEEQLTSLHAAWHCNPRKRFVLLSGLSGTGKTAVTMCYAKVVCELMGLNLQQHREIVPVSPDWRDPSGLLGYFNALHADPTFQAEAALRLVLRAARDSAKPYFLLLDEMNLARVERYFAPFLSAMETGEPLVLHTHEQPVNGIPARIPWPTNLFIAGTVNMDETTHPFSDKVLDRAFTLEFWEVDLERYFRRQAETCTDREPLPDVEMLLVALNAALRSIRRHFGYRTAGEVLAFVRQAGGRPGAIPWRFVDHAVFAKVLPRLRGEDSPDMQKALEAARALCTRHDLKRSVVKLDEISSQLKRTGVAGFWA